MARRAAWDGRVPATCSTCGHRLLVTASRATPGLRCPRCRKRDTRTTCPVDGRRLPPGRRRYCSDTCATTARPPANHWGPKPARRTDWRGPGAADVIAQVEQRAAEGEPCYFYRRPGHDRCPGAIDLTLDRMRDRWAFTVHHMHRRMHGGPAIPDAAYMAPAHRSCNSRDGLYAQNARRGWRSPGVTTTPRVQPLPGGGVERTSEAW